MTPERVDEFMARMAPSYRYRWCEPTLSGCACLGCANFAGKANDHFSKATWEEWKRRHPETDESR